MKIKNLFSYVKNKRNNQVMLSLKKKEFKKLNMSVDDFLDLNLPNKSKLKKW